jgi:hypothetical protein
MSSRAFMVVTINAERALENEERAHGIDAADMRL